MSQVHLSFQNTGFRKIGQSFGGFVAQTGKLRGTTGNADSDKMASAGLTEKQLQLSVEV